jgi:hypothetical protein
MPGFILHSGAVVQCLHLGMAQPVTFNPRVTVSGQPIVTMTNTYSIVGCTLPASAPGSPPCATAQWTTAAARVTAMGQPVLLRDSQATCIPTGTPLLIMSTQPRVSAM